MRITDVRVFPRGEEITEDNKLKAYASITFDDSFVVSGLKVIDGKDGLFVAMPGKKMPDGKFLDTAHPLNTFMRKSIELKVIEKFNEVRQFAGAAAR